MKFEPGHLDEIIRRDVTGEYGRLKDGGFFDNIGASKWVYTAIGQGGVIAIAGVHEYWEGRGEAWILTTAMKKKEFLAIHRAAIRFLDGHRGRVECVVAADFPQGKRWARMLGFQPESTVMRQYFPNGGDAFLYARVR